MTTEKRYVYCDIETDGLNPSVIWCAVCKYKDVSTVITTKEAFHAYVRSIPNAVFVGHNFIGFDVPVLKKLWGFNPERGQIVDTLLLSRLYDPSKSGGHSLRNWGDELGFPKGDHDDWSCLSADMIEYCIQDVKVTQAVHERLMQNLEGFSEESIELEHQVQWIIQEQVRNGWLLDERKAHILQAKFKEKMNEIQSTLEQVFPPIVEERWSDKTGKRLKDKVTVFNVGSRQQVADRLTANGAVWAQQTPTGRPVVDEGSLKENEHIPEAKLVLEYLTLQKRESQVRSWTEKVERDGRVRGRVTTNGAITGRMTHQGPNMAQTPSNDALYGADCRSCWIVPPDRVLVGGDASGLELRMLAHYMGDKQYTEVLLNEDIHTRNQMAAGLDTRSQAKTFIYAFLYGAGDPKIGGIVGGTARDGRNLKQRFLRNTPALKRLRERVGNAAARGYLVGLDGRKLWVRSEHAALNTLLQGAGAIIMKKALVILVDKAEKRMLDYSLVGNIHDEIQAEVQPDHAEAFGEAIVESIVEAGLHFDLRCPLDGEYKIGNNWSETH